MIDSFLIRCSAHNIPAPQKEYRFCPHRRWRLDYAWPEYKLAVEIEGGIWKYGRHNRASGFLSDMEKYNELAIMGWSLLRFTPEQIEMGDAMITIQRWFAIRRGNVICHP